ncbi:class I tRNA ligase family protein [Cellulomonas carbonis]|uniref:class I tRNA ligase family protein n=1 Tax=Cellulomonas carbonis TaxID=1386092 RepID=UPI000A9A0F30|nr:class I tRNA ligase family protein [Cellulomonas carbonis]
MGEEHFLTPVCLVPNGRAHLGHVAGPLLRMDVLRRMLRWSGAITTMIGMSDVHESYVTLQAHRESSTPHDVAGRYHQAIQADLAALDIVYDDFLDVLDDPEWRDRYEQLQQGLVDEVERAGHATTVVERMPRVTSAPADERSVAAMVPQAGEILTGAWLAGRCPDCGAGLGGFSCESCGSLTWPEQMPDVGAADERMTVETDDVVTLQLDIPGGPEAVLGAAHAAGVRPDFLRPIERYLDRNGARVRLTAPGRWGVRRSGPGLDDQQVIWQGSALQIGCHFLAGERCAQITGRGNPLAAGSPVISHMSFGIDNTVPYMVGGFGTTLAQTTFKPVDNVLTNYFFRLDGEKFSTSRRHVIWAGDSVTVGGADPDVLRAYLAWRSPETSSTNFSVDEFLAFHNALVRDLDAVIGRATASAAQGAALDGSSVERLGEALARLDGSLTTAAHSLTSAYGELRRWLDEAVVLADDPATALGALAGLAHLANPVMPRVASAVWEALTGESEPTLDGLRRFVASGTAPHRITVRWRRTADLSAETFGRCVSLARPATTTGDER